MKRLLRQKAALDLAGQVEVALDLLLGSRRLGELLQVGSESILHVGEATGQLAHLVTLPSGQLDEVRLNGLVGRELALRPVRDFGRQDVQWLREPTREQEAQAAGQRRDDDTGQRIAHDQVREIGADPAERDVDTDDVRPPRRPVVPNEDRAERAELVGVLGEARLPVAERRVDLRRRLPVGLEKGRPLAGRALSGAGARGEVHDLVAALREHVDVEDARSVRQIVERVHHPVVLRRRQRIAGQRTAKIVGADHLRQRGGGGGQLAIDAGDVLAACGPIADPGEHHRREQDGADDEPADLVKDGHITSRS